MNMRSLLGGSGVGEGCWQVIHAEWDEVHTISVKYEGFQGGIKHL